MTTARERIAEERRHEIIDAALGVFVRKGLAGATMQDIAAAVGLTAGALYRYVPGKDDLVTALFEECEHEQMALFAQVAESSASPLEAIVQTGVAAWALFDEPDARDRMAMNLEGVLSGYRDELAGAARPRNEAHALSMMGALVTDAQTAGELRAEIDATALATLMVAVHVGLQQLVVQLDGAIDAEAVRQLLTDLTMQLRTGGDAHA